MKNNTTQEACYNKKKIINNGNFYTNKKLTYQKCFFPLVYYCDNQNKIYTFDIDPYIILYYSVRSI